MKCFWIILGSVILLGSSTVLAQSKCRTYFAPINSENLSALRSLSIRVSNILQAKPRLYQKEGRIYLMAYTHNKLTAELITGVSQELAENLKSSYEIKGRFESDVVKKPEPYRSIVTIKHFRIALWSPVMAGFFANVLSLPVPPHVVMLGAMGLVSAPIFLVSYYDLYLQHQHNKKMQTLIPVEKSVTYSVLADVNSYANFNVILMPTNSQDKTHITLEQNGFEEISPYPDILR